MKYLITFSIFGKEMKCTITGKSKDDAEYKLRGKLKIVTIEPFVGESVKSSTESVKTALFGSKNNTGLDDLLKGFGMK